MYADDTHTTAASNDITELITMTKKELLSISDWSSLNKLSVSPQKIEFMLLITNVEWMKSTTSLYSNLMIAK